MSRRVDDLARQAEDLRDLFARLEAARPAPPPPAPRDRARAAPEEQLSLAPAPQPKPGFLRPFPSEGPITMPAQGRIAARFGERSEEHTSELQSLMRISYAVFCLKQKHTN